MYCYRNVRIVDFFLFKSVNSRKSSIKIHIVNLVAVNFLFSKVFKSFGVKTISYTIVMVRVCSFYNIKTFPKKKKIDSNFVFRKFCSYFLNIDYWTIIIILFRSTEIKCSSIRNKKSLFTRPPYILCTVKSYFNLYNVCIRNNNNIVISTTNTKI